MLRVWMLAAVALAGCLGPAPELDADAGASAAPAALPSLPGSLEWKALAAGPNSHAENVAVLLDGRIYSIGGYDSTNNMDGVALAAPMPGAAPSAYVDVYDILTDTWTRGPDYPVALDHQAGAASMGAVYVFDGTTSYKLAGAMKEWTGFSPPPFRPAVAATDPATGLIYLAEWGTGQEAMGFARYDPRTDSYEELPDYPEGRNHNAAAWVGGRFYLSVGDLRGHAVNTVRTDIYDPAANAWTTGAPNPVVRGSAAATEWFGRFVVLGGQNQTTGNGDLDRAVGVGLVTGPASYTDVHVYDPMADAWTELPPMPTGRHGFSAVTHEGRIYAVNGAPQQGFSGFSELDVLVPMQ